MPSSSAGTSRPAWTISGGGSSAGGSSFLDNMSVWESERAVKINTAKRLLRFVFKPDLYINRGRMTQTVFFGVLCLIAFLIVLIQLGIMARMETLSHSEALTSLEKVKDMKDSEPVINVISKERYTMVQYMAAVGAAAIAKWEQTWQAVYDATFQLINGMEGWPFDPTPGTKNFLGNAKRLNIELEGHRSNIKRTGNASLPEMAYYSDVIDQFLTIISVSYRRITAGKYWRLLVSYIFMATSRNEVDRTRTLSTLASRRHDLANSSNSTSIVFEVNRTLTSEEQIYNDAGNLVDQAETIARRSLDLALFFSNEITPLEDFSSRECQLCKLQKEAIENALLRDVKFEVANKSFYDWEIRAIKAQETIGDELLSNAEELAAQTGLINLDAAVAVISTCACCVTAFVVWSLMIGFKELRTHTENLSDKTEESDALLYQMLPMGVAQKLKTGTKIIPEFFDEATVYFNDVYGFNGFVTRSQPSMVVTLLNQLYSALDKRIELYGCYKVETVSDTYMVVSGVPNRRPDHAAAIALMALDLLETARAIQMGNSEVRIRIGIHSGPVFAGVVGLIMPRYCLFGDTVNTASRMESTSKPSRIQISEKTYNKLSQHGGFHCEFRGLVAVKGKGEMKTYWLTGMENATKATALYGVQKVMYSEIQRMYSSGVMVVEKAVLEKTALILKEEEKPVKEGDTEVKEPQFVKVEPATEESDREVDEDGSDKGEGENVDNEAAEIKSLDSVV